jgi:hypothetical protein
LLFLHCRAGGGIENPQEALDWIQKFQALPQISSTQKAGLEACRAFIKEVCVPLADQTNKNPSPEDVIYNERYTKPAAYVKYSADRRKENAPASLDQKFCKDMLTSGAQKHISDLLTTYANAQQDKEPLERPFNTTNASEALRTLLTIAAKRSEKTPEHFDSAFNESLLQENVNALIPVVDDGEFSAFTLTLTNLLDFYPIGFVSSPMLAHGHEMSPFAFANHDIAHCWSSPFVFSKPLCLKAFYDFFESDPDELSRAQVILGTFMIFHERSVP